MRKFFMTKFFRRFNFPFFIFLCVLFVLCGLTSQRAEAQINTVDLCMQNGGSIPCIAPIMPSWEVHGSISDCAGVRRYIALGDDPNIAVDKFLILFNEGLIESAKDCNHPDEFQQYTRLINCNEGEQHYKQFHNPDGITGESRNFVIGCKISSQLSESDVDVTQQVRCPDGYEVVTSLSALNIRIAPYACLERVSPKNLICPTCDGTVANSINVGIGNQNKVETDYRSAGPFPLEFSRYFNNLGVKLEESGLGWAWRTSFDRTIDVYEGKFFTTAHANRHDGRSYIFRIDSDGQVSPMNLDVIDKLELILDSAGNRIGWRFIDSAATQVEVYSESGQLLSITNKNGLTQNLSYDAAGELQKVVDSFGRQIELAYDAKNRISKIATPGGDFSYEYNENGDISSVTNPDTTKRNYQYATGDSRHLVINVIDENERLHATYSYGNNRTLAGFQLSGGAERLTIQYTSSSYLSNWAYVTDGLGTRYTYITSLIQGVYRPTSIRRTCIICGFNDIRLITYDANGNVSSRTDFNGIQITYAYDLSRNLETKRVEAFGTPQARTITTEWHPTYRLPTRIAEPSRLTVNDYDARGNLLSRTVQATNDASGAAGFDATATGTARHWSWTYNQHGQVLTATGPRTDINEVTSYAYDGMGNLVTITNAAGHVTTLSDYDLNGRAGRIEDPNGLVTELTYSPRGWLTSRRVGNETTLYDYDGVGQLVKATHPDGAYVTYTYDDAHRLIAMADSAGNRIDYTLDAMGNRIKEEVKDPQGQLARQTTRVYDALNRLQEITGGMQ